MFTHLTNNDFLTVMILKCLPFFNHWVFENKNNNIEQFFIFVYDSEPNGISKRTLVDNACFE